MINDMQHHFPSWRKGTWCWRRSFCSVLLSSYHNQKWEINIFCCCHSSYWLNSPLFIRTLEQQWWQGKDEVFYFIHFQSQVLWLWGHLKVNEKTSSGVKYLLFQPMQFWIPNCSIWISFLGVCRLWRNFSASSTSSTSRRTKILQSAAVPPFEF